MIDKESWMRFRQQVDTYISRLTRNKIKDVELGSLTLTIHERRRGRWTKVPFPNSEIPLRGKENDIVYTIFDGQVERKRLGQMAKEQAPLRSMLQTSPAT